MTLTKRQQLITNLKKEVESGWNRSRTPRKLTEQEKEQKRNKLEEAEAQEESDKANIVDLKRHQAFEANSIRHTVG